MGEGLVAVSAPVKLVSTMDLLVNGEARQASKTPVALGTPVGPPFNMHSVMSFKVSQLVKYLPALKALETPVITRHPCTSFEQR